MQVFFRFLSLSFIPLSYVFSRQQGEGCSVDCLGDSCESVYLYVGACFVPSVADESDCSLYATTNGLSKLSGILQNSSEVCVVLSVSEDDCGGVPFSLDFFFFFWFFFF